MSALPAKPSATLRHTILLRVTMLMAGTALFVGAGFIVFGLLPLSERIAQGQFSVAATRVEASLDATFPPAARLLAMSEGWLDRNAPDLDDPGAFNRLYQPVLRALPQVTSVVAGTSTGQGWLLLAQPGGRWRNRMTDVPRHGKRHLFFDHAADGSVVREWREVDYDARKRPWYTGAMQSGGHGAVYWTAPYVFFTTGDPGITASTRMRLRDGRDFVIGFDLMLRDLSRATMLAAVSARGLALVVTEDHRVLALPPAPATTPSSDWVKNILKPVDALQMAPVTDAFAYRKVAGHDYADVFRFESGGDPWLGRIQRYALGDQMLRVVTLAPAADFAPAWDRLGIALASGIGLVLFLAFLILRTYARRIAGPLEQLATASERIGRLDFTPAPVVDSPIAEIRQLAGAQEEMRTLLQRHQEELAAQAQQLNHQITAQRETEARLRESEAYNKVLFVDSRISLVVLDPATRAFVDCNDAAVAIYRLADRDAVLRLSVADVSAEYQYDGSRSTNVADAHVQRALNEGSHVFEWRHRRPDGSEWDAEVHLMRFRYAGRTLLQFSLQDITQKKAAASEIAQLAFYDTLTGLPNRRLLANRLEHALAASVRSGNKGALLFIDLDNFKALNDTFGHDQGDKLLKHVAARLVSCVRDTDTVGRFGGDEFLVMLEDLSSDVLSAAQHTETVGQKILDALNQPYIIADREHFSSPSIGVTLFADPGDTVDELVRRADVAMYQAKSAGRNALRFFDPLIQAQLTARTEMEAQLRQALTRGELVLHYQVQVNEGARVVGAEALVRWNHPRMGMIQPGEFIPLAEESGHIVGIGQWVLHTACNKLVEWSSHPARADWVLAVNVSSRQFRQHDFVAQVQRALFETGANPRRLTLELTESMLLDDVENTIGKMMALRTAGVRFSLDDFGIGYSSLSYLKRLPLDELKIDRSFVRDVLTDVNDAAIARAIVTLAQSLGLAVIAEGVETEAQRDFLAAQGCRLYQGYLFGRPGEM